MCPQCDKTCDYWRLSDTCLLSKITSLFDNSATLAFAIFMCFWSVLYLELWNRRSAELSYRWGLVDWDRAAEHPRPQYLKALSNSKFFKVKEKVSYFSFTKYFNFLKFLYHFLIFFFLR